MQGSFRRWTTLLVPLFAFTGAAMLGAPQNDFMAQYKGSPYHDSRNQDGAQKIPGKVMCAQLRTLKRVERAYVERARNLYSKPDHPAPLRSLPTDRLSSSSPGPNAVLDHPIHERA